MPMVCNDRIQFFVWLFKFLHMAFNCNDMLQLVKFKFYGYAKVEFKPIFWYIPRFDGVYIYMLVSKACAAWWYFPTNKWKKDFFTINPVYEILISLKPSAYAIKISLGISNWLLLWIFLRGISSPLSSEIAIWFWKHILSKCFFNEEVLKNLQAYVALSRKHVC